MKEIVFEIKAGGNRMTDTNEKKQGYNAEKAKHRYCNARRTHRRASHRRNAAPQPQGLNLLPALFRAGACHRTV